MIKVDPGAQRTDAFQESRNLLLSDGAHADAIPGLEIEANDVRCTHAATVASIDEDQLFYLQSRGLTRAEAERLLVGGFLEVIAGRLEGSRFLHDPVRPHSSASSRPRWPRPVGSTGGDVQPHDETGVVRADLDEVAEPP